MSHSTVKKAIDEDIESGFQDVWEVGDDVQPGQPVGSPTLLSTSGHRSGGGGVVRQVDDEQEQRTLGRGPTTPLYSGSVPSVLQQLNEPRRVTVESSFAGGSRTGVAQNIGSGSDFGVLGGSTPSINTSNVTFRDQRAGRGFEGSRRSGDSVPSRKDSGKLDDELKAKQPPGTVKQVIDGVTYYMLKQMDESQISATDQQVYTAESRMHMTPHELMLLRDKFYAQSQPKFHLMSFDSTDASKLEDT